MIYISESVANQCAGGVALLASFCVLVAMVSVTTGWKKALYYTGVVFLAVGVFAVLLTGILENIVIVKGV